MKLSLLLLCLTGLTARSSTSRVSRQAEAGGTFQVQPRRALVAPGGSVSMLGRVGTPLQFCHFYLPGAIGRLVDLSLGHASPSTAHHEYEGAGLQSGECGIRIKRAENSDDGIVECKVKPAGGGQWQASVTTLRVTDIPAQNLPVFNIMPQRATLSYGDSLTVSCNADQPVTLCHIYLPGGIFLNYDRGPDSEGPVNARYHGSGLEDGECGVTLSGVDRQLNGYVVCKVGHWPNDLSGLWETDAVHVTVTKGGRKPTHRPPTNVPLTACPALTSPGLLISCSFAGEETDCSQPQDIGTTAYVTCKPGYVRVGIGLYTSTNCKTGGRWDRPLFHCRPDCGRRRSTLGDSLPTSGQASEVEEGEFSWTVAVYKSRASGWKQMCGGSLITPSFFISAAKCFWDLSLSKVDSKDKYRAAAGRHSRNWDEVEAGAQTREVSDIFVPNTFNGRSTNYMADIAVVRLATPFQVTSSVNLVCVDWENLLEDRQLAAGRVGLVAGWGFDLEGKALRVRTLPFVSRSTCLGVLSRPQRIHLTPDKFCAGTLNHSLQFCGGDIGTGIVFKRADTDRFYLRGISSVSFTTSPTTQPCHARLFTGFTKLSSYMDWVAERLHS